MRALPAVVVLCVALSVIGLMWEWTDRNIEYLCSEASGRPVEVHGGLSLLATLVGGPVVLPFNVGVEIYALCVEDSEGE